jgi:hypothetical protein
LARTIADFEGSEEIQPAYLADALQASAEGDVELSVNLGNWGATKEIYIL